MGGEGLTAKRGYFLNLKHIKFKVVDLRTGRYDYKTFKRFHRFRTKKNERFLVL